MNVLRTLCLLLLFTASLHAQQAVDARDAQSALATLAGAGIRIGDASSRPLAAAGGEIVWNSVADETARDGSRHVVYQQSLRRFDGTHARLAGGEVAVHFDRSGAFVAAEGRQFTNVRVEGRVRATAREDAELLLLPTTRGTFRFAYWMVHGQTGTMIDAENMAVLRTSDLTLRNNCTVSSPHTPGVSAIGFPVRGDLAQMGVRRFLYAGDAPDRSEQGYLYDAFWNFASPNITVYQQTDDINLKCNGLRWTIFPVDLYWGAPTYINTANGPGSVAGDAMHRTHEAMSAFHTMGRDGWDGRGGEASIIIESTMCGSSDCGTFVQTSRYPDPRVPGQAMVAIAPAFYGYNIAASLDIIAPEWGHGVIFTSASNFDLATNFPVALQLHEGFADVLGQMTEKLREPSCTVQRDGSCLENPSAVEQSADWNIGEDASPFGQYLRSGNLDDGTGGHVYLGSNVNNLFHRNDAPYVQQHDIGNMLNVVFYLLAKGGANPACARFGNCNIIVPALGFQTAAQILFDTVQFTARPNSRWEDLAQQASLAAFNRYASCSRQYDAGNLQDAVDKAFSAIGYPRTTPPYTCP